MPFYRKYLWILPLLALLVLVVGSVCSTACVYLTGTILSVDLTLIGVLYYAVLLAALLILKDAWITHALIGAGMGSEVLFIVHQIKTGIYCPKCLLSGACLVLLFLITISKKRLLPIVVSLVTGLAFTALFFQASVTPAYVGSGDYPVFGNKSAPAEVVVYSDYFCPACSQAEEAIAREVLRVENTARIIFVDVPIHRESMPYIEIYLYAWMEQHHALAETLSIKKELFHQAQAKTDPRKVLEVFRQKKIPFREDRTAAAALFRDFYVMLLTRDAVNATPSVVIEQHGRRTTYVGLQEIIQGFRENFPSR